MPCLINAIRAAARRAPLAALLALLPPSLSAQMPEIPAAPFPIGRADLPETRTLKTLRPGITHLHVERGTPGAYPAAQRWSIVSRGKLYSETEVAAQKAQFDAAGVGPVEEHWFEPGGEGARYCLLSAGHFGSKVEAQRTRLKLSFQNALVVHNQGALGDWQEGPHTFNLIIIDPQQYRGRGIVSARGPLRTRPSELSRERGAVVAINAGFFNYALDNLAGVPSGTLIINGEWYHTPNRSPSLAFEKAPDGSPQMLILDPLPIPEIKFLSGETRALDQINQMPRGDEIAALHPEILAHSGLTYSIPEQYLALQLDDEGYLHRITNHEAWDLSQITLIATGKGREFLEEAQAKGQRLAPIDLRVPGRPTLNATYGVPILIRDGQDMLAWWSLNYPRSTRSAAATDAQGRIYILSVDGEAFGPTSDGRLGSVGANWEEISRVFRHLGDITQAVNLDGSGSLAIDGQVASKPYNSHLVKGDGVETPVADSLLVLD